MERGDIPDEKYTASKANQVLQECKVSTLPVKLPEIVSEYPRLQLTEEELDHLSGALGFHQGEFMIIVPAGAYRKRKRFSIAHELGHYHLSEHTKIFRQDQKIHEPDLNPNSDNPFENEANAFASELLMPADLIRHFVSSKSGWEGPKAISEQCETSFESASLRYVQLSSDPLALIVSIDGTIKYCSISPTMKTVPTIFDSLPLNDKHVPKKTATRSLYEHLQESQEKTSVTEMSQWFPDSEIDGSASEQAKRVGHPSWGRVLTLLEYDMAPDRASQGQDSYRLD